MPVDAYLIVEQRSSPPSEMPRLLKELAARYDLDGYSCRQLLLGQAEALLARGGTLRLTKIRQTLADHEFRGHVIAPSPPQFAPFILSRFEIHAHALEFIGREKSLTVPRGSRLLIFLAELSGSLAERSLGQILSAHRYTGRVENSQLPLVKWQRTILQGRPVLDIYLLDEQGRPTGAVRAFPGKFDHRSLGERATLSATQNLLKLIELAQEYAGHQRVDMRFGLSLLPDASLQLTEKNDLEGLKKNLRALTHYAWLQADIDRQREQPAQASEAVAAATDGLHAATQAGLTAGHPLEGELIFELTKGINPARQPSQPKEPAEAAAQTLPTPPELQRHKIWTSPAALIGIGTFLLIGMLVKFGAASDWVGPLLAKAFSSGAITALLAAGLFSGGFRRLQLKRLIENTPTSKIRSIAMGRVEVHGRARRQYALISPMTNSPSIYYRLVRYKRNQKDEWVVSSITSSGHVPFWIEDDTGQVSVDPTAATVKAGQRQESRSGASSLLGGAGSSDEKWVEEIIPDGALVYVLGEAQVKKTERSPIQQRRAEALRRIKQDKAKLAGYDTNHDGKLDESEWQAARDAADVQLLHEDLARSSQRKRQQDQVVISKPRQRGLPFVIAETAAEANLTGRYAWATGLLFAAASAFSGISLWLLARNIL